MFLKSATCPATLVVKWYVRTKGTLSIFLNEIAALVDKGKITDQAVKISHRLGKLQSSQLQSRIEVLLLKTSWV